MTMTPDLPRLALDAQDKTRALCALELACDASDELTLTEVCPDAPTERTAPLSDKAPSLEPMNAAEKITTCLKLRSPRLTAAKAIALITSLDPAVVRVTLGRLVANPYSGVRREGYGLYAYVSPEEPEEPAPPVETPRYVPSPVLEALVSMHRASIKALQALSTLNAQDHIQALVNDGMLEVVQGTDGETYYALAGIKRPKRVEALTPRATTWGTSVVAPEDQTEVKIKYGGTLVGEVVPVTGHGEPGWSYRLGTSGTVKDCWWPDADTARAALIREWVGRRPDYHAKPEPGESMRAWILRILATEHIYTVTELEIHANASVSARSISKELYRLKAQGRVMEVKGGWVIS